MSGFSADWLTLREPIDRRSRDTTILAAIARYFSGRDSIAAIDLASGRGSMIRALTARLPARQHWIAVDDEAPLLREAVLAPGPSVRIESRLADLAVRLEDVLALKADLVVSSAFIDLVSDAWLDRLIRATVAKSLPVYLALSYDGRAECRPHHPLDGAVIAAFGRHQQRDKGFGVALGPMAGEAVARKFAAAGYQVQTAKADWRITGQEREFQFLLLRGWFDAVAELAELDVTALAGWYDQRRAWIAAGQSTVMVGHLDVWAVPG